ncbi:MAG: hypothetical protein JNM50_05810 [Chromatiales bacterium]|jgi:hypothetical protein|nr:hypothetical protein [Chromatiales bacterium]
MDVLANGVRLLVLAVALMALGGCALAPPIDSDPSTLETRPLCHLRTKALVDQNEVVRIAAEGELQRRQVTHADCDKWVGEDRQARAEAIKKGVAITAAIVIVTAAAIAAANNGGGSSARQATDYEWDWDVFYNEYGQLTAACRGVQTGQFADRWHCNGKAVNDYRWPGK